MSYSYVWQEDGTNVSGVTASWYTPSDADVGQPR